MTWIDDRKWELFCRSSYRTQPSILARGVTPPASVADVLSSLGKLRDTAPLVVGAGPMTFLDFAGARGVHRLDGSKNCEVYPTPDEQTHLSRYMDRVSGDIAGAEYSILVTELQAVSHTVWTQLTPFLDGLYRHAGVPLGGATLQAILGNYTNSLFGLHKDTQDVITFVVEGRRRYHLWPLEYFASYAEEAHAGSVQNLDRLVGSYVPHVSNGLTFEAEPGDVLYWPASYWHAVQGEAAPSVTLSLGLFHHRLPEYVLEALQVALTSLHRCVPGPLPTDHGWREWTAARAPSEFRALLHDAAASISENVGAASALAAWTRNYGFRFVPNEHASG